MIPGLTAPGQKAVKIEASYCTPVKLSGFAWSDPLQTHCELANLYHRARNLRTSILLPYSTCFIGFRGLNATAGLLVHYELNEGLTKAKVKRPIVSLCLGRLSASDTGQLDGQFLHDPLGRNLVLSPDSISSVSFEAERSALAFELMDPHSSSGLRHLSLVPHHDDDHMWQEAARHIAVRYQQFWASEIAAEKAVQENKEALETEGEDEATSGQGDDNDRIAKLARRREVRPKSPLENLQLCTLLPQLFPLPSK